MIRGDQAIPLEGGTTVGPPGLLRRTVYFGEDEWQAIRKRSFEEDQTYTDVVRLAVRTYLGIA
jgi:hypothetical protein